MPLFSASFHGLVDELRRRRVFRTAAAYAIAAWLVVQIAATVFPALGLPDWTVGASVWLALIGFPIALALSWIFRLNREPASAASEPGTTLRLEVAHPGVVALASLAVVVAAGWAVLALRPGPLTAFPTRGWAIIADLENHTGDPDFDGALAAALAVDMEQSAYVNIAPASSIDDALRRMRRQPGSAVDAETAREIAQRNGLDLIIVPAISGVGGRYVVAVRLLEPSSGRVLRTLTERTADKASVLPALDVLCRRLRETLGESGEAIARHDRPLQQATTSSLYALKQYSLGYAAQRQGRYLEAKRLYELAIREDSAFARALASLGTLEWEMGRQADAGATELRAFDARRARPLLERAVAHLDGVGERERYAILTAYAFAVDHDLDKAIDYERARLAEYPDSYVAHNNLGRLYYYTGRYEESVAEYKHAIELVAGAASGTYDGVVATYLYLLGQVDSARVWAHRELSRDPDYFRAYDYLGWAYLGEDSLLQARGAFRRAVALEPDYALARWRLVHTLRLLGRYDDALATLRELVARDTAESADYDFAVLYGLAGRHQLERGHLVRRRDELRAALAHDPSAPTLFELATVLTRLGDPAAGDFERRGLASLRRAAPLDPSTAAARRQSGTDDQGWFELAALRAQQGRDRDAVAALAQAAQHGLTNFVWILAHPDFQQLRGDADFRAFMRRRLHLTP